VPHDVLVSGRDRGPGRLAGAGARFPHLSGALAGAAVLALLVLGAAQLLWVPDLPRVEAATTPARGTGPPWQPRPDGRPTMPPRVHLGVVLERSGPATGDVLVVGVAGPGVSRPMAALGRPDTQLPLPAVRSRSAMHLPVVLDCAEIDLPARPGAYQLLVRAQGPHRDRTAPVGLGVASEAWAQAITRACSSWLARNHLTVDRVSAEVDAVRPRVALRVALRNDGRQDAHLAVQHAPPGTEVAGPDPVPVPAGDTREVALDVVLDRCDIAARLAAGLVGHPLAATDALGLVGSVGTPPTTDQEPYEDGPATGLVTSRAASAALAAALSRACGGLERVEPLADWRSARYDAARARLRVDVVIAARTGASLRIVPDRGGPVAAAAVRTPWLESDRSGRVRLRVTYDLPVAGACPLDGGGLAPFVVEIRVPDAGQVRTARFSGALDPLLDPLARATLCPGRR
jgi:hypothetical protein